MLICIFWGKIMGIEIVKKPRSSKEGVATYAKKMKASGYKQVSFFLSPTAHESLIKLTKCENNAGASLAATNNRLLELLKDKEFIYLSVAGELNVYERKLAIIKSIQHLQIELADVKKYIEEYERQYEMTEVDYPPLNENDVIEQEIDNRESKF